jgi:hypothetical protein
MSGACVTDSFAWAKGCLKRLDTFTVPHTGAQAAGRIHPVKNMRPGPSGCQSNALIASNDDDRGEDDGRVDDGVGAPASGAGTVSADMRARIGPAVDAKCSHPKGINDLLTITIY